MLLRQCKGARRSGPYSTPPFYLWRSLEWTVRMARRETAYHGISSALSPCARRFAAYGPATIWMRYIAGHPQYAAINRPRRGSEENPFELQSLMRISYADFSCTNTI